MTLFLDTEWADVFASELVSLALVSRNERFVFYAERHPLPEKPTDFVHSVVYPLLKWGDTAMHDPVFAARLQQFIADVAEATGEKPTIAYDYWADRSLFEHADEGFERDGPVQPPVEYFDLNELSPDYAVGYQAYFSRDPQLAASRHNALTDAHAARNGYLGAIFGQATR